MDILKDKEIHTQGGIKHITEGRKKEYKLNNLNIMLTIEQINRLRNIINIASMENTDENKTIVKLCNEILFLESSGLKAKKGSINIYDYVSKNYKRPIFTGVYHKNGEIVATDAHILLIFKNYAYEAKYEGKIISKSGEEIEGKYPNYNSVKPSNNTEIIKIDRDNFNNAIKADKAKRRLLSAKEKKAHKAYYKINEIYLDLYEMEKFINAMEYLGTDNIQIHPTKKNLPILSETSKGWTVLMPCVGIEENETDNIYNA